MPYTLNHPYVDQDLGLSITRQGDQATVHCSASGSLPIRFSGKLNVVTWANYRVWVNTEDTSGHSGTGHRHRECRSSRSRSP